MNPSTQIQNRLRIASRKNIRRRNQLLYLIIALVILGAAKVSPKVRQPRDAEVEPIQLPDPYPEFQAIALLLRANAEANIGAAITPQDRGRHLTAFQPNLARFQLFREGGNANNPINSVEMHKDGTIYVAYTPTLSPTWYQTIGAEDNHKDPIFDDLKKKNVDAGQWLPNSAAFPPGRGSAPLWFKISIPSDPSHPSTPLFKPDGWLNFLRSGAVQQVNRLIRHATPMLPNSGNYCYRDTRDWTSVFTRGDPPEWATVLPMRNGRDEFGQRTLFPGSPYNATTNPYVTWDALMELMQSDPTTALDVLKWRGHPNTDDYNTDRVPWISAATEGIVTNSFLSGLDYAGDHMSPPSGYFLGSPPPKSPEGCGTLEAKNSLCDDWIVYVRPDPEYRFLLARRMGTMTVVLGKDAFGRPIGVPKEIEQGNFDDEHQGDLENEIEQWLVPVGWRPEPGDRIYMTGRWVIDCGHNDWHGELHPFELAVSSHSETGGRPTAIGKTEVVSSVVITGAWQGGTLEFDVWPPARPEAGDILKWKAVDKNISMGLSRVSEQAQPLDNPNHLHVTVISFGQTLRHSDVNDVYYNVTRRLVSRYRLWWESSDFDRGRVS